jgi:hypothetical protein
MPTSQLTVAEAEQWLSVGRMQVYLNAARSDPDSAFRLYDWNARVTTACLRDIEHLEVLVRNRYDGELKKVSTNWTSDVDPMWTRESGYRSARALQAQSNATSRKALTAARRNLHHPTHGQVIANLTFGFWTALTRSERDSTFWTPILHPIFPGLTRGSVHNRMERLNSFRNRLAHWEPVFSQTTGLMRQLSQVDDMFNRLSPEVALWVGQRSTVVPLIKAAPEALLSPPPTTYLGIAT